MRTRTGRHLAAVLLLATLSVGCAAPAPTGARVVQTQQVAGRMWDLTVDSPALGQTAHVRLLLPTRFADEPTRQWPVLWLLHGCCDDYQSWTRSTDVEALTRASDVLVAMPDGGSVGFYSDWLAGPAWETFHTVELPALLAAQYRAGGQQAVAGVSMGGLGALDYAAHHRGRFVVAASFSGIVHTTLSPDVTQNYRGLVRQQSGGDPDALWGNPVSDAAVWARHNPYDLVGDLVGTRVFLAAGDGRPGPYDIQAAQPDEIESSIGDQNRVFADRLRGAKVDAQIDLYGAGTHNWVYWQRELHRAWPSIARGLGTAA